MANGSNSTRTRSGSRATKPPSRALAPQECREDVIGGGTWQWLPNWQWVRRADLEIPMVRRGEWITCPPEQRSDLDFLSWQIAWRRDALPVQRVGFAGTDLAGQLRGEAGLRARS